jgi:hypothetical protein
VKAALKQHRPLTGACSRRAELAGSSASAADAHVIRPLQEACSLPDAPVELSVPTDGGCRRAFPEGDPATVAALRA